MSTSVNTQPSPDDLAALNKSLDGQDPIKILEIALKQYEPRIILACGFGAEDVVLVDMMLRINPRSVLFYLDTDFLFPETYAVRDRIIKHYQLQDEQIIQMKSTLNPAEQATQHGEDLWLRNPDQCCELRKMEPLTRVLKDYSAWITGIRRDQSPHSCSCRHCGVGCQVWTGEIQSVGHLVMGSGLGLHSYPKGAVQRTP